MKRWLGKKAAPARCRGEDSSLAVRKAPPNQAKRAHEPKRKGKAPRISRKREGPKHKRISSTTPSLPPFTPTGTSTPRNPRRRRRNPRRGGDHRYPLCWRRERAAKRGLPLPAPGARGCSEGPELVLAPCRAQLRAGRAPPPQGSSRTPAGRCSDPGLVESLLESFCLDEDWFLLSGVVGK